MKNIIKKLLGIDKIEAAAAEAESQLEETFALATEKIRKLTSESELRLGESLAQAADEIRKLERDKILAEQEADRAQEQQRLASLSAKELSNERGEPYIQVMEIKVNKDNIRNGFFELDWNSVFVLQLVEAGYTGASEEEIVERWFQDTCRNIGTESGVDLERRAAGLVNFNRNSDGTVEAY